MVSVKAVERDFPHGSVVMNLPCNAGDVGSIPHWGTKISHASEQASQFPTTREYVCLKERPRGPQPRPEAVIYTNIKKKKTKVSFPGGPVVMNPPCNAGNTGSIPDPVRSHMQQSY